MPSIPDLFFQIILFLAGAIIGVFAQILGSDHRKLKILLAILAIFFIITAFAWARYEVVATPTPTPTKTITLSPLPSVQPTETLLPNPTSGLIVFASDRDNVNGEIYLMSADGTNQTRLTNNSEKDYEPAWSPDGKFIAFCSERDGFMAIYIMNADGTNQHSVAKYGCNPAWSPDGRFIAFSSYQGGNWEIYVMNSDGTNQHDITNNPRTDTYPSWSPDGRFIAFHTTRDGVDDSLTTNWEIYVMNADGSNQKRLTNNPALDWLPSWSPDGKTIAFWSPRDGGWEIYLMNADGSNQRRLTKSVDIKDSVDRPAWSPDGHFISYDSVIKGNLEIQTISIEDIYYKQITESGNNYQPAWLWSK